MFRNIYMPNIGAYEKIVITDILISNTNVIKKNDNMVTVESGKTSVDIASPYNGEITDIYIAVGDEVKPGNILVKVKNNNQNELLYNTTENRLNFKNVSKTEVNQKKNTQDMFNILNNNMKNIHKVQLTSKKRVSNSILFNSWTKTPHVTQFSEIDISRLIILYLNEKYKMKKKRINLMFLPFIIKAVTTALIKHPYFNASLCNEKEVILKKYYNIGIVTTTKNGLLTPVIRNTNTKNIFELNDKLLLNKKKIENNELTPCEFENGSFSISSLGSYTNGFFTPIIKYPESAILGVSKYQLKPIVKKNKEIVLVNLLPISISYDHRVIDGLDCLSFIKCFHKNLNEIKSIYDK